MRLGAVQTEQRLLSVQRITRECMQEILEGDVLKLKYFYRPFKKL